MGLAGLAWPPANNSQFGAQGLSVGVKGQFMVRRYFGTDGIRGRANKVITPELALKVGQAAGLIFKNGEHAIAS